MRTRLAPVVPMLLLLSGCLTEAPMADGTRAAAAPLDSAADGDAPANEPAAPDGRRDGHHVAGESSPPVFVHFANGTITEAGAGHADAPAVCCTYVHFNGTKVVGTFGVSEPTTAVVAELQWNDTVADLDLVLRSADFEWATVTDPDGARGRSWADAAGQPTQGGGRAVLLLDDADALSAHGRWAWEVRAKAAHDTAFQVRVSVFHGIPPPDGYTAFG